MSYFYQLSTLIFPTKAHFFIQASLIENVYHHQIHITMDVTRSLECCLRNKPHIKWTRFYHGKLRKRENTTT